MGRHTMWNAHIYVIWNDKSTIVWKAFSIFPLFGAGLGIVCLTNTPNNSNDQESLRNNTEQDSKMNDVCFSLSDLLHSVRQTLGPPTFLHIWNLEKWYRWTYLQGRNRDADAENRHGNGAGEGVNWETEIGARAVLCIQHMASGNLLYSMGNSVLRDDLDGWDVGRGGRSKSEGMCMYICM